METTYYERLSALDSSFIRFDAGRGQLNIGAIAVFDPATSDSRTIDIESFRAHVDSRLHLVPRYRQCLQETPFQGHPIWVDDDRFDLTHHVRRCTLSRPGGSEELKTMAASIASGPLDMERPLWELWLVEGLENGGHAVIAKMHHCLMDGVTGVGVLQLLLSPDPSESDELGEPTPPWQPRRRPDSVDFLLDGVIQAASLSSKAARNLASALMRPVETAGEVSALAQSSFSTVATGLRPPPDTPLNQPIGRQRRVEWHGLDLQLVKDVKKRLDGTVNDVILAVVAGAARHFFQQRKLSVNNLDLRVIIPVDTRVGAADEPFGNQVSSWFLDLPVSEKCPLERFRKIRAQTTERKKNRAETPVDRFLRFADWTGSSRLPFWGVRLVQALQPYNLIVSNVYGPPVPLYLMGARMSAVYPGIPLFEGQALTVGVMSYTDRICFGLQADRHLVPDIAQFAAGLEAAFDELRSVAEQPDRPARVPRRLPASPGTAAPSVSEPAPTSSGGAENGASPKTASRGGTTSETNASPLAARNETIPKPLPTVAEAGEKQHPTTGAPEHDRIRAAWTEYRANATRATGNSPEGAETPATNSTRVLPGDRNARAPGRSYAVLMDHLLGENPHPPKPSSTAETPEEPADTVEQTDPGNGGVRQGRTQPPDPAAPPSHRFS